MKNATTHINSTRLITLLEDYFTHIYMMSKLTFDLCMSIDAFCSLRTDLHNEIIQEINNIYRYPVIEQSNFAYDKLKQYFANIDLNLDPHDWALITNRRVLSPEWLLLK